MNLRLILLTGVLALTSSCTSLSKEECQTIDWHERGKSDGLKGKSSAAFANYRTECTKHGITPNQNSYSKGRSQGLELFCTYDKGYQFGLEGENYEGVCPAGSEKEFLRGFNLGKREHKIKEKEEELEQREKELEAKKSALIRSGSKACTFDSDCSKDISCMAGKCNGTGHSCTFDSDCKIEGRCASESEWIDGTHVNVNYCKYGY